MICRSAARLASEVVPTRSPCAILSNQARVVNPVKQTLSDSADAVMALFILKPVLEQLPSERNGVNAISSPLLQPSVLTHYRITSYYQQASTALITQHKSTLRFQPSESRPDSTA